MTISVPTISALHYNTLVDIIKNGATQVQILDHINGFDANYRNLLFDQIADYNITVWTQFLLNDTVKKQYPNLKFKFDANLIDVTHNGNNISSHCVLNILAGVRDIPLEKTFDNFICSINGMLRADRRILVAALMQRNWWNFNYCTKNFFFDPETVRNDIRQLGSFRENDIVNNNNLEQYARIVGSNYMSRSQVQDMQFLAPKINGSFMQLVGETFASSYHPFLSEKFTQPIACKSLWVAFAQPGYHGYLEECYGFRKYSKLFDYTFDNISNPVDRLLHLLDSISKYATLSKSDWKNLYEIEKDTIEFNYEWYHSRQYLVHVQKYALDNGY